MKRRWPVDVSRTDEGVDGELVRDVLPQGAMDKIREGVDGAAQRLDVGPVQVFDGEMGVKALGQVIGGGGKIAGLQRPARLQAARACRLRGVPD